MLVCVTEARGAATPVVISGFETADVAGTSSYEIAKGGTTSAVNVVSEGRCARSTNDGAPTSFRCLKLTPAAGQSVSARFLSSLGDVWAMGTDVASVTRRYHLGTVPSSGVLPLGEFTETDASPGLTLVANPDRTLTVSYGGTDYGSTAPVKTGTCSSNTYKSCETATVADDCASGDTCVACNTATGAGCAKVYFEAVQRNGLGTVTVDVWLNGNHILDVTAAATDIAPIDDWVDGSLTLTAGTGGGSVWIDDARLGDGTGTPTNEQARMGWGPIHAVYPTDQRENTTTANSCATSEPWSCLDDWASGATDPDDGIGDTTRARDVGDRGTFLVTPPTVSTIGGVGTALVGRTSNDTFTYQISTTLAACDPTTCVYGDLRLSDTADGSTTHALVQADAWGDGPTGPWDQDQLDALGVRIEYEEESKASAVQRWSGLAVYIAENLPDVVEPTHLPDRNGDGIVTMCFACDSLCLGTFTVACKTSQDLCSQPDYCEWDSTHDKPIGGCGGNDAVCRTCTGNRDAFNGGAGIPCTSTDECTPSSPPCPGAGCTCDTGNGVCVQNALIPCTADGDCEGFGTCPAAVDAECIPSCPEADSTTDYDRSCTTSADCSANEECLPVHGSLACMGICPDSSFTSWGAQACGALSPDVTCAIFPQGSEHSSQLAENRWDGILQARHHTGTFIRGTGLCACATSGDCATGACVSGRCEDVPCTKATDCTYPTLDPICDGPDCDYIGVGEGTNDSSGALVTPECTGVHATVAEPCANGCESRIACTSNDGCSARGPDAICYGQGNQIDPGSGGNNGWCLGLRSDCMARGGQNAGGAPVMVPAGRCRTAADCTSGICWDADADPLDIYPLGFCGCTSQSHCVDSGTWTCVDADLVTGGTQGICRRKCSVDATCGGGTGECTGSGYCKGSCDCPTSKDTCTTDTDCPVFTGTRALGWTYETHAQCVSGRCAHGGISACERHDPQAVANLDAQTHRELVRASESMQAAAAALAPNDPVVVFSTSPKLSLASLSCSMRLPDGLGGTFLADILGAASNGTYLGHVNRLLRAEFPYLVDIAARYERDAPGLTPCHTPDGIHLATPCALWWGKLFADRMNALGTCGVDRVFGRETQRYCRKPDETFRSPAVACTDAIDCTVGDSCALRVCDDDTDCPLTGDDCEVLP